MSLAETDNKANILVVDDRADKLLAFQAILEELNENVFVASSGEDALKLVLEHDFAVILMDVNMPEMDGFETASLIRRRKRSAHFPIIFVTAFPDEMHAMQGYSLGAVDYILSPVLPQVLRTKVRVLCDLFKMTEAAKRQSDERVTLVKAQAARAAAEEERRRSTFLSEASNALATSLEFKATLKTLARLPVPTLADLSVVAISNQKQEIEWLEVAQSDGKPSPSMDEPLPERFKRGLDRVFATLKTEIVTWTDHDDASRPDSNRILAGQLGTAAFIPLIGRRHEAAPKPVILGILCLAIRDQGRFFSRADLLLAEDFAARAAVALENALLYERLRESDRKKNEFLAMLAHELRNPLSPIGNAIEVLKIAGDDPDRRAWCAKVLQGQHGQLVRLVDDLLDLSRITSGNIDLRCTLSDVNSIVTTAVETVQPLFDTRHQALTVKISAERLQVYADPARLSQALSNLLNNASKYTPQGGHIWLSVQSDSNAISFGVCDDGIGIQEDLLPKIFDLFMQVDNNFANPRRGMGIGLTLVRRLIEAHGGSVTAYSAGPNQGSEFVISVPALPQASRKPKEDRIDPPSSELPRGLSILVVDDNEDVAEATAAILELKGCEVRTATDGPSAIQAIRDFGPQVVLLDIGLPEIDGYEVARQLRALPLADKLVLIAVSGYGRAEDIARSAESGFDHHLVKPVDVSVLANVLRQFLVRGALSQRSQELQPSRI